MVKACNGQNSESVSVVVYQVTGEPAIVINGSPNEIPIGSVPIHLNDTSDSETNSDPLFGEWLEGRQVRKLFGGQYYSGKVVKYDSETNWYRIVYEDGDFEDLEWHELENILLPLDISIPLMTLALQRCKCEMYVSDSGIEIPKSRKCDVKNVGSMKKGSVLLQNHHASRLKGDKQIEVNVDTKRTQKSLKREKDNGVQARAALQKLEHEKSSCEQGENNPNLEMHQRKDAEIEEKVLEPLQSRNVTELDGEMLQVNINREATEQGTSKRQSEIQNQRWRTSRAEKKKRRDKSLVQVPVTEVTDLPWGLRNS